MASARRLPGGTRLARLGQALLVLFAAVVGASLVVPAVADALVAAGLVAPDSVGLQLAKTVLQFATFVGVIGVFVLASGDRSLLRAAVPSKRGALLAGVGLVALIVLQFVLLELLTSLGLAPGQNRVISPDFPPAYYLVMIVVSVLVVGPAEELLFRGTVQGLLRRAWSAPGAIAVASLLFGLVHYPAVTGTQTEKLAYVALAAILGTILGILYEQTRNVAVPALAHGGYNAVLFAIQYLVAIGVLS